MSEQNIKLVQISGPTLSIVSTSEAKNYLKLGSDTTDDNLVTDLVKAATAIVEREAGGLAICEQSFKQYQQGDCDVITLQREPVLAVSTISYYENFDSTAEILVLGTDYRRLDNELYHSTGVFDEGRAGDGYTIEFSAGLFTASTYTSSSRQELSVLKSIILRIVAYMYENREEWCESISEGTWKVNYHNDLPQGIKRLIMPFHTGRGLL